ncbi:MAG: hypothetical protein HWE10_07895 [Gammaproteobacteria bacterium]|nr:hypothetical protein [Gammaproteobacteria bacterium]
MMQYLFFVAFAMLAIVQLGFPILASKIKFRFDELGYKMESEPSYSWLNVSNFWAEARRENKTYKDPLVRKYLALRTFWWILVIICFIGFAVSG